MKCPVCQDARMREVEKNGILIDVCPECKGVWLDRGELEKLMTGVREYRREYERDDDDRRRVYDGDRRHDDRKYDDDNYRGHGGNPKYKKKRSVFDIFDDLF